MTEENKQKYLPGIRLRILMILCLWFVMPFCVGEVGNLILNKSDFLALAGKVALTPFLGWLYLIGGFISLYHWIGGLPQSLQIILVILSFLLHTAAWVLSVLYCIKAHRSCWIISGVILFLMALMMTEIA